LQAAPRQRSCNSACCFFAIVSGPARLAEPERPGRLGGVQSSLSENGIYLLADFQRIAPNCASATFRGPTIYSGEPQSLSRFGSATTGRRSPMSPNQRAQLERAFDGEIARLRRARPPRRRSGPADRRADVGYAVDEATTSIPHD
jgi:hypothetical protein